MKKTWIILLLLVVLVTASILIVSANQDVQPEEPTEPTVETEEKKGDFLEPELPPYEERPSESYPFLTNAEFDALPAEKQEALRALNVENNRMAGRYLRREQLILGTVTEETASRMDLETAKRLIAENANDPKAIIEAFDAYTVYDCVWGSGMTRVEYWFDDARTEMVHIFPNHDGTPAVIAYVNKTAEEVVSQQLYPWQTIPNE